MFGEPRQQSWTKVKTDERIVIDVGSVTLGVNALVPVAVGRRSNFRGDRSGQRIFARRLVRGHPGRAILPAALIGALLLTASDLAVRLAPLGRTLPIGVVTALIGVPFFLWLVARMRWRVTS